MAAQEFSFDIVSKVDLMEVKNGVDQAQRELAGRFDFRGSIAEIELKKDTITLTAEDEFRLEQLRDILLSRLSKRGIEYKMVNQGKIIPGSGLSVHQDITFKMGIPQDQAKALVKQIKDKGLKVNAQIQGEEVRVTSKSKDDLQKVMTFVKGLELPYTPSFNNLK